MNNIYLIYLRKSRADNPNESVEEVLSRHERILQELAIKMLGKKIDEEYIFREVVSGETIEDRPEIKVLFSIEKSTVKGVLVVDPQRLSRGDWEDGERYYLPLNIARPLLLLHKKIMILITNLIINFLKWN
ncbi:MAG: recombinase family protein [Thomasclavelia sp.]